MRDQIDLFRRCRRSGLEQGDQLLSGKIRLFPVHQDVNAALPVQVNLPVIADHDARKHFQHFIQAALPPRHSRLDMVRHLVRLNRHNRHFRRNNNFLDLLIRNRVRLGKNVHACASHQ